MQGRIVVLADAPVTPHQRCADREQVQDGRHVAGEMPFDLAASFRKLLDLLQQLQWWMGVPHQILEGLQRTIQGKFGSCQIGIGLGNRNRQVVSEPSG